MVDKISAVILAAGESRRMGQPKMLLKWGETTVLGRVVSTFAAGLSTDSETDKRTEADSEIVVVTGAARQEVERLIAQLADRYPLRTVFNSQFAGGEMLSSIQAGLAALRSGTRAALIGLGDQPQVRESTVRNLCTLFMETGAELIIPSFQNRRGHPWLAARSIWPQLMALPRTATSRDFLQSRTAEITYLPVEDDSILKDVDTPEDYASQRP